MKRVILLFSVILMVSFGFGASLLLPSGSSPQAIITTRSPLALPGRHTLTPSMTAAIAGQTPQPSPQMTSPFSLPTRPPQVASTPLYDCTTVFPLDSVQTIEFGRTTIAQLEASFGQATYQGGRPLQFRFEQDGCRLKVTLGGQEAQEAELTNYGTLDLLLTRYEEPAVVGVSQGNLTLLMVGNTVLLYPDEGIIAIFDLPPDALTRETPIGTLQFRPAYDADKQLTRLKLRTVEWQPPLR